MSPKKLKMNLRYSFLYFCIDYIKSDGCMYKIESLLGNFQVFSKTREMLKQDKG